MSDIRQNRKVNPHLLLRGTAKKEQADRAADVTDFDEVNPNIQRKRPVGINVGDRPQRQAVPPVTPARDGVAREARPTETPAQPRRRVNPAFVTDEVAEPTSRVQPVRSRFADVSPAAAPAGEIDPPVVADAVAADAPVDDLETTPRARVRRVNPLFADVAAEEETPARGESARSSFPRQPGGFQRPGSRAGARVLNRHFVPKHKQRAESPVSAEDWTDDESNDPEYGLGARRDTGRRKPKYEKAVRLSNRDIIIIKFLARYRYAWRTQLAYLLDTTPESIAQRLRKLENSGFIRKQHLTDRQYLWMSTKAGNILVNCPFPEIKKGSLSPATIQHTIGIGSLAIELEREGGGKDILGERRDDPEVEPVRNRYKLGIWGHEDGLGFGEMTVSEREIRQGQLRWRGGRTTLEMRELVDLAIAAPPGMEAQELLEGNEGLFVVYGANGQDGEHIPDLVVSRARGEQNEVRHIAIELELTGKSFADWKRILRWYRDNGVMYDKVYYFTHNRAIATALRRVDEEVGLGERLEIRKYNPRDPNMPFWG